MTVHHTSHCLEAGEGGAPHLSALQPVVEIRDVPGHPGYRVTSEGLVLGKRGKPLSPRPHWQTGHLRVRLYGAHLAPVALKHGKSMRTQRFVDAYVHVLVCTAWHGPPPFEGAIVLHHNDVSSDNRPENLRWGTHRENAADRQRNQAARDSVDEDGFDWSVGAWRDSGPLFQGGHS
ncbi:MAG: HNH endonuclease signature motif containing protein [Myxococcota bacterium]